MYTFHSWILDLFPSTVRKLIDTNDRLTDRHRQFRDKEVAPEWFSTTASQERKGLQRADTIIAIQEQEARFFRSLSDRPVVTVGHIAPINPVDEPVEGAPTLLFLGSDNRINGDAIGYCVQKIWPKIRSRIPNARLLVAGAVCRQAPYADGVEHLGVVENLADVYRRSYVVISPLRFGTGLKIKCIEAMSYGKPLVTTPAGAEGMESGRSTAFLVASGATQLADQCAQLLQDCPRRRQIAMTAISFVTGWNAQNSRTFERTILGVRPSC
jgi:glycosyltransferase involved in cell wall biosynthesis